MDCVGNTTNRSTMRGCATKLSGRGRLPRPIPANSRRQARQTSDILIPTATPAVQLRRYSRWVWSSPGTKVFRKGSPTITTSLLLLVLELPGIPREMVRPPSAADGDSSTTRSSNLCSSNSRLSRPSVVARSYPKACSTPLLFFKMEPWRPIPLTGFLLRCTEPRPTGPPSVPSCCLGNLNPNCARSTPRSITSGSSIS